MRDDNTYNALSEEQVEILACCETIQCGPMALNS